MTLYNVVEALKTVALRQPNVNGCYEGSVYEINANPSNKYANVIITQRNHRETENTFIFHFIVFFCDRLISNLKSNKLQIQSNGISVLSNIFKTLENEYDIEFLNKEYTTWEEKFTDELAGCYCDVQIEVYKQLNCAEEY